MTPGAGPEPGGEPPADHPERLTAALEDPGAVRNTLLQLASQLAGLVFTGGLTLYLVRALGASQYGVYALAVSIGALALHPAGLGLPWSVGRYLADHLDDLGQVRSIFVLGLRLQSAAAVVGAVVLLALSGTLADLLGHPHLGWPLRWVAVSVIGQALFAFLASAVQAVRRVAIGLWMALIESIAEAATSAALVIAGAGAAGAVAGKVAGYTLAALAGVFLTLRLLGGRRRAAATQRLRVGVREITRYAGAMFVVNVSWSAIDQIDVVMVGALLSSVAVGSFSAALRLLIVPGYLGLAVSAGVAPRLSLRGGGRDTQAFGQAMRYLIVIQGLVLAPMLIWSHPIVNLLLGPGYHSSPAVLQVLSVQAFLSAPASLLSVAVTYLGEARRRVWIMIATLAIGLVTTYVLIRLVGVVGAAIGDDVVHVFYVSAHLWLAGRLITVDRRSVARSLARTLVAAGLMALVLLAVGTGHLSVAGWVVGLAGGAAVYVLALLVTREVSPAELRALPGLLRSRARPAAAR